MERIKLLGLAVVAALALSVAAASSASASLFLDHLPGGISGSNIGTHFFKVNGGTVECTGVAISGTALVLRSLTQLVHVKYTGCNAFGTAAAISTALYVFNADLTVGLENEVIITDKTAACKVTVGPAGNQTLKSVHYSNSGQDLKVNAAVTGIIYNSSGGVCGTSGTNGEYTGEAIVGSTTGGVVRWDK